MVLGPTLRHPFAPLDLARESSAQNAHVSGGSGGGSSDGGGGGGVDSMESVSRYSTQILD